MTARDPLWTPVTWLAVAAATAVAIVLPPATSLAKDPAAPASDYQPDPLSVVREGSGYRYTQAGWIVVHIEGAAV